MFHFSQGSFTALLLAAVSLFTAGEATEQNSQECAAASTVKLSQLFGLRYNLLKKKENLPVLIKAVEETEAVLRGRENLLNITLEGTERLEMAIGNISTPEFNELELSQICDEHIPRDCCQVKQSVEVGFYFIV